MLRPSRQRLVDALRADEIVALGDEPGWPSRRKAAIPHDSTMPELRAIVDAACASSRVQLAKLRGTLTSARNHTALLLHIASRLPESRLLCLNLGEFDRASDSAYEAVVSALGRTLIGHLYWRDPVTAEQRDQKRRAQEILRRNRAKPAYRALILEPVVRSFMRHGCHAWWDPQPALFARLQSEDARDRSAAQQAARSAAQQAARSAAQQQAARAAAAAAAGRSSPRRGRASPGERRTARCRARCRLARCRGTNRHGLACCLCTLDASGYCRHHRP